ncbi:MAG: lysoplasmalogenase [Marinicellaceae bacterium]
MFVSKPLLMPILIVWAFLYSQENLIKINKLLMIALLFSMFGDISLMFLNYVPDMFLLGLLSFLIVHILYIYIFLKAPFRNSSSYIKKNPLILITLICYGLCLILFLYKQNQPEFVQMQIPVIIYALVILLMLTSAINIYQRNIRGMYLIILGAFLFVLSDSTIALSQFSLLFNQKQDIARIIIMCLYGIAQFMIVKGYLMSTISYQSTPIKSNL